MMVYNYDIKPFKFYILNVSWIFLFKKRFILEIISDKSDINDLLVVGCEARWNIVNDDARHRNMFIQESINIHSYNMWIFDFYDHCLLNEITSQDYVFIAIIQSIVADVVKKEKKNLLPHFKSPCLLDNASSAWSKDMTIYKIIETKPIAVITVFTLQVIYTSII